MSAAADGLRPRARKGFPSTTKPPQPDGDGGLEMGSLALTYFHMGKPHTIIGDAAFHCCVRDGNRWFHRSMDARRRGNRPARGDPWPIGGKANACCI